MADKEEKVEVNAADLKAIVEQNQKLLAMVGDGNGFQPTLRNSNVANRTVSILFINGKAVIGYVNHGSDEKPTYIYEAPDPKNPKEYVLYVDVILRGKDGQPEKDAIKLNYTDFLRESERKECLVKEIKEEPWIIDQGEVERKEVPEGKYYASPTGFVVPVEVKGVTRSFIVELPDHSTHQFHERYVNIAK